MKNKLQIIIVILILVMGFNAQECYAEKNKGNKKNYKGNKHGGKKHSSKKHINRSKAHKYHDYNSKGYSDGLDVIGDVLSVAAGTYVTVDSTDSGVLDDSSERADRFIYSQIPQDSREVEINNLFLSSLNPFKEIYEVRYVTANGARKCFKVEESGVIRSIYKKSQCD